jgi:hypothetical protein
MRIVTPVEAFFAGHRFLVAEAARAAGFADPVAVDFDVFADPLVKAARRGPLLPLDGVLVRDWDPDAGRTQIGCHLGLRVYHLGHLRFVLVSGYYDSNLSYRSQSFGVVDRCDYAWLYRRARELYRDAEPPAETPVMTEGQAATLWQNTIGYLDPSNLRRIKAYGGRPRRGVLLTGPPGNGKTSACRWLRQECRERGFVDRTVTPDDYQEARRGCNPRAAVQALFEVEGQGLVFFDDMDLALRDRESASGSDDQAVFLGALDGMTVNEGVAFVFTTNCPLGLIDRAFKRPGRIDVVLQFDPPDAALRRRLITRWHPEIRAALDADKAVETTAGLSFAEIEEVKNQLILHAMDGGSWDWPRALRQLETNRRELAPRRSLGFGLRSEVLTRSEC